MQRKNLNIILKDLKTKIKPLDIPLNLKIIPRSTNKTVHSMDLGIHYILELPK